MEAFDDKNKHTMAVVCLLGAKGAGFRFRCKSIAEKAGYLTLSPTLCDCRQGLSHLSFIISEMGAIVFACWHPNVVVRLK